MRICTRALLSQVLLLVALCRGQQADPDDSVRALEAASRLNELAQNIRYYDEVLTQSARNYAFTEDAKWLKRYRDAEPVLDKAIQEAMTGEDSTGRHDLSTVNAANVALVEMESRAIQLVTEGRARAALKILDSDRHREQKEIYGRALTDYVARRHQLLDAALLATVRDHPPIPFTAEEKAWLREHPVIRVHNEKAWPPFNFFEHGEPRGLSIDYMNLLSRRIGVQVEYVTGPSWSEFLSMLRDKELDVMLNIVQTEDRQEYVLYTEPYIRNPNVIVSRKDEPLESVEQLDSRVVSFPKGFFYEEVLAKSYPGIRRLPVADTLASLKAVALGEADACLGEEAVVRYLVAQNLLAGLRISGEVNIGNPDFVNLRLGVRDDWPLLRSVLSKAAAAVAATEMARIRHKWLLASEKEQGRVQLTDPEKAWIEEHKVIRVGVDPTWAPIEFIDSDGNHKGLSSDLLDMLSERLGLQFEPVRGLSWADVLEGMKAGQVDMLSAAAATPGREQFASFTAPYITLPLMVFTRNEHPYIGNMNELSNDLTAVVDGYAVMGWLRRDWPNLRLLPVGSVEEGLQAVVSGKAAHYIDALLTTSHSIQRLGYAEIKVAGGTPYKFELCLAARHDWPHLQSILQKGLDSITDEEHNSLLREWRSIQYEHGFDYAMLWQALAVAAAVLALFIYWNRRLAREVNERRQAQAALRASREQLRLVFDSVEMGIVLLDAETRRIVDATPMAVRLYGGTRKRDMVGHVCTDVFCPDAEGCPVLDHGQTVDQSERTLMRLDGTRVPILKTVTPLELGGKNHLLESFVDLSERKAMEDELRRSEERFRQTFEHAPVGIVRADAQGHFTEVNTQFCRMLGYTADELRGKSFLSITFPDDQRESRGVVDALQTGNRDTLSLDKRYVRKDSTVLWGFTTVTAQRDADGAILELLAAVEDITERREAEEHLRLTRFAMDSAGDAVWWHASDTGQLLYVNEHACTSLGYSREELLGMRVADIDPDFRDGKWPDISSGMGKGTALAFPSHHRRRDGSVFPVEIAARHVEHEGRGLVVAFARDVSERERTAAELRNRASELERFNRLAVGRELRMIEIKREINTLLEQLGQGAKYRIVTEQGSTAEAETTDGRTGDVQGRANGSGV